MPYLLIVTALWAFSFSLIGEYLAGRVDSDFAVLVRVLIAALVFLPLTLWRGLPRRMLAGFWLAGALQFGITYLCLYRSFQVLTVPEVLLFTVLTPIYVTLLDDALARRFSPWALLAALVAVGGGVIIRFDKLEGDYLLGFLLRAQPTQLLDVSGNQLGLLAQGGSQLVPGLCQWLQSRFTLAQSLLTEISQTSPPDLSLQLIQLGSR